VSEAGKKKKALMHTNALDQFKGSGRHFRPASNWELAYTASCGERLTADRLLLLHMGIHSPSLGRREWVVATGTAATVQLSKRRQNPEAEQPVF